MFRPVLCWLVVSALLFLGQYHHTQASRTTMQFTVSMEGRNGQVFHDATLNGLPYHAGNPCGVGWRRLIVRAENAEQFETNCFVWYGGESFGNLTLPRSRGGMDLELSPAVETLQIVGTEERKTLTNITHESLSLPTGRYTVGARFARFSVERTVEVTRNQTTRVAITPELPTLNLSSDPDKAEFVLRSKQAPEVSVTDSTPTSIAGLPAGEYELVIAQGDYRKNLPVRLTAAKATNELKVEFRYAKLSITSDPADASITDGSKVLGRTPASLDLQPGSYRFQIVKDGYFATNVSLTLTETDSQTVSVGLTSISFVEALERAHRQSSGLLADYNRALADVEKALVIKPDDPGALQLKQTIGLNRHLHNARELKRNREYPQALFEVEAALKLSANSTDVLALKADVEKGQHDLAEERAKVRRNRPQMALQEVSRKIKHYALFPAQMVRCTGSLETAHANVVRALGRKPEWSIQRTDTLRDGTTVIHADASGTGWMQNAVLALGQTADNEVSIHFKLFAFVIGEGQESGFFKPLHPQYATTIDPRVAQDYLERETTKFQKRIEEELR